MPYISKEDLEQARRIDLLTYLKTCEPDELVSMGHEKYKLKSHDSLKLSNGKWFWWSHNIGGSTALDYLIRVKGIALPQAVLLLSKEYGFFSCKEPLPNHTEKRGFEERKLYLPQKHTDNERVKKYLLGRGIAGEIIEYCIAQKLLYEESRYHNAVERIQSMRRYGERIQKEDFWQKQEAATKPSVFVYAKERTN